MLRLRSALLALALGSSASIHAGTLETIQHNHALRVCFEAGYMPFEMKDKNGKDIGFDIDIAKLMAKSMAVDYTPVNTAWDGIIPALMTDKCDIVMSGMTITAERNLKVNFADPYIVVGQTVLLSPAYKDKVHNFRDLNNPSTIVITKLGTTGDIVAKKMLDKAQIRVFESEADGVMEVLNGKAAAFIYDLPLNAFYKAQNGDKLIHLNTPFTYEPLGWAIRQGDADFLNFLNNFLRQIKGDGSYDRLYQKWFEDRDWITALQ
ncbi:amino acid ABC transporter substrate-binding protein [Pokkaliibacter plantistimulans]|uniref:Amino acid ABC transporter substrate-binding protein n=1 Tax=Pokkaliibacter plantistimulans TaxID=1635171 RepID=A0ABX5LW25_9GAMM|nr:transporter substrate-binding domain-containing protein [Pokkaliibacter plantistimulans]PXF29368.1 amino acid ABC transporter substrate-binding protein [Pokkaliibacter plantistimulans]